MATGEIHGIDENLDASMRKEFGINTNSSKGRVKELGAIHPDGNKVVVSKKFSNKFKDLDDVNKQKIIDDLKKAKTQAERDAIIKKLGGDNTPQWAKGTEFEEFYKKRGDITSTYKKKHGANSIASDEAIHHRITMKNLKHPLVQKAVKGEKGFKINHADANGTKMSTYTSSTKPKKNKSGKVIATNKGTHASHDVYSDAQDDILSQFERFKKYDYTQEEAIKFLNCFSNKLDEAIKLHCPKGGRKVDELFKHKKFKQTGVIDPKIFFKEVTKMYNKS